MNDMVSTAGNAASQEELHNLDLLRTVAVLFVYIHHLRIALGDDPLVDLGRIGVLMFFVHTSFVLMMSLARASTSGEPLLRGFYLRRAFRIYPLSVACVLAIVIFQMPRAPWWPYAEPSASTLVANLLLYMNLVYAAPLTSVLWSLPYEIQMYVLLPALYLFGRRFKASGVALLWLLACGLGLTLPLLTQRLDLFSYGPCFLAGVLAYFLWVGPRIGSTWPAWIWPASLAVGVALFHTLVVRGFPHGGAWLMCLGLAFVLPRCRELPVRWLQTGCALIARYSYGVYLTHLWAMWLAFVVLKGQPVAVQWSVLLAMSIGVPVVLFHLIEKPFVRLGAKLAGQLGRPPRQVGIATPPLR